MKRALRMLLAAGTFLAASFAQIGQTFVLGGPNDGCTGGVPYTFPASANAPVATLRYDGVIVPVYAPDGKTVIANVNEGFTCVLKAGLAGNYNVTLNFIEPTVAAVGARLFDLSVNGVAVLSNFDIFATGGTDPSKLVTRTTHAISVDGNITIMLKTEKRSAVLASVATSLMSATADQTFLINCGASPPVNCANSVPVTTFTLAHSTVLSCLRVLHNGEKIYTELNQFSLNGTTLSITQPIATGDIIEAIYVYNP